MGESLDVSADVVFLHAHVLARQTLASRYFNISCAALSLLTERPMAILSILH
jgi:hypothetical protein